MNDDTNDATTDGNHATDAVCNASCVNNPLCVWPEPCTRCVDPHATLHEFHEPNGSSYVLLYGLR